MMNKSILLNYEHKLPLDGCLADKWESQYL